MDLKRRIALSAAILSVGLGAGQLVQSRSGSQQRQASLAAEAKPTAIMTLSAGAEATKLTPVVTPAVSGTTPVPTVVTKSDPVIVPSDAAEKTLIKAAAEPIIVKNELTAVAPVVAASVEPLAVEASQPAPLQAVAADCTMTLDLVVEPAAMLGVTLTAPCHKGERVVLKHGGLAITAQASATGSVFMTLPAMEKLAKVSAVFIDGESADAQADVPEVVQYRRFGVQWLANDAFQVHAFEGGADYGMPGHISAADPHVPMGGAPAKGGFLTLLGDDKVALPMLAEIYTYPMSQEEKVDVVVEAAVTGKTCGREMLGETLTSFDGESMVTDLTMAMPGCEATGDILVLKNLVPEMKVAAN